MGKNKKKNKAENKADLHGVFVVSASRNDITYIVALADRLGMGYHELTNEEREVLLNTETDKKADKKSASKEVEKTKKVAKKAVPKKAVKKAASKKKSRATKK